MQCNLFVVCFHFYDSLLLFNVILIISVLLLYSQSLLCVVSIFFIGCIVFTALHSHFGIGDRLLCEITLLPYLLCDCV